MAQTKQTKTNEPKAKKQISNDDVKSGFKRALYMVAFATQLAIGAYLLIQVNNPDKTQVTLGVFAIMSAVYYFVRVISTK